MRLSLLPLFTLAAACLAGSAAAQAPVPCQALRHAEVPRYVLALPTLGARVDKAKLVRQDGTTFCRVLGTITSLDPRADNIHFELNLPEQWNGKAVHFGGAAFNGWLPISDGRGRPVASVHTEPTPLARGYSTFGSDSGHHKNYFPLPGILNLLNARFALNPEMRRNYAQDALKKVHDTATALIRMRYGKPAARMFFLGGSTGGREAYFVTQRWPADYDGVLGAYAGWDQVELDLQFIRVAQATYAPGGFLGKAQTKRLAESVLQACDAQDGIADGLVSNPHACSFNPATLVCSATPGKGCLSPAQLHTVQTYASEQRTAQPLAHGVQSIPGYNVLAGADLTGSLGFLHHAEHPPRILLNSFAYVVGDQVLRFFLTRDPHFNALTFDTTSGGPYAAELLPQSEASDASDSNLAPFLAHGGKLILLHGTADATIPTGSTELFYTRLQQETPAAAVASGVRFYEIPGFGHGRGGGAGGGFNAGFDALGVLDRWLDGTAPAGLVAVDNDRPTRTRPLCDYPAWPRYAGSGPVDSATSFACVQQ